MNRDRQTDKQTVDEKETRHGEFEIKDTWMVHEIYVLFVVLSLKMRKSR